MNADGGREGGQTRHINHLLLFLVYFILSAAEAKDEELQEKLWTFSEKLAREKVKA